MNKSYSTVSAIGYSVSAGGGVQQNLRCETQEALGQDCRQDSQQETRQVSRFELTPTDASYPEILVNREVNPQVLCGLGSEDALSPGVAIIGARNATPYGKRIAKLVATWAADLGLVVYSGGARGCDQAAHQGALEAGGTTVAVMGCGADIVYPSRAGKLLNQIAQTGAVVSEYPWGSPPMKYRFRNRNRLIAALSDLVVVVEARLPSGTLSTVHHALELGVPVAAVPGSILCLESAAPNRLISEGAFPICCRNDLAIACNLAASHSTFDNLYREFERSRSKRKTPNPRKASSETQDETRILQAVRAMPALPDNLAVDLDMPLSQILETLGSFEVQGQVKRYPDGRYGCDVTDSVLSGNDLFS